MKNCLNNKLRLRDRYLPGFTLIEILMVITIMIILIGITVPFLRNAEKTSMIKKTRSDISKLELALSMYQSDFGNYPDIDKGDDTNWVISWLTGFAANGTVLIVQNYLGVMEEIYAAECFWKGPYLKVKKNDLDSTGNLVDPWGEKYGIDTNNPVNNVSTVDIYSNGPDRTHANGGQDDITNWQRW